MVAHNIGQRVDTLLANLIDELLEITVIGSFSHIGYDVRSRVFAWTAPSADALAGRTILLTGATSGLGREAANQLAGRERGSSSSDVTTRSSPPSATTWCATTGWTAFRPRRRQSSLESVHGAVERVVSTEPRLDVLIDNAGAMFPTRQTSPDGIEATLATMVVGPFVLIAGLQPLLRSTPAARVVSVTSGGQYAATARPR